MATDASPKRMARMAGFFYLLTIVTGALALKGGQLVSLAATGCYVAVTLLFYRLFLPVSRPVSTVAALFSLAGCAVGALAAFDLAPFHMSSLVFFGVYCLLIGYLIFQSRFLPRVLGVLMVFGGLGWLTFAVPPLSQLLTPYNMLPGVVGESVLTIWLLAAGVNETRWHERAAAAKSA
jgi:hypothetical protein